MKSGYITILIALMPVLVSCGSYNKEVKMTDSEYKYEAAKGYFFKGQYRRAQTLAYDVQAFMKGTHHAEEALYLLGLSTYGSGDYSTAADYFRKYYKSYPRGRYVELSRYYCGRSLYEGTLDSRLDQEDTHTAIKEFQDFLDLYPNTSLKDACHEMLLLLQDKLVAKEYGTAKLYFNLGSYMGNCTSGGSNFEACIVTCENALRTYPYASEQRREDFGILLLRARRMLARESVPDRRLERYRATVDEYYAFANDFPDSKYMDEAKSIFEKANSIVESNGGYEDRD